MFQSVERICVPSNLEAKLAAMQADAMFQSVERICVPSNRGQYRCFLVPTLVSIRRTDLCAFELQPVRAGGCTNTKCFNPSNGFVCLRTSTLHSAAGKSNPFQSVERICVPSNSQRFQRRAASHFVSIRRTDLCAFELFWELWELWEVSKFQSVERICVPSNMPPRMPWCISRCFNPSNGFVCLRTSRCYRWRCCSECFNPSNGFVCLRTATASTNTSAVSSFQSVERICVPSNAGVWRMLLRTIAVSIRRTDLCAFELGPFRCLAIWISAGFNPSNGFVCLRTRGESRHRATARVSIRRTDLCAFEPRGCYSAL